MPRFGTFGVEMATTCFSTWPDNRSNASQIALGSISSNSSKTSSDTGMDFKLLSPRLPRMYKELVPVDFKPTVLVSTNSDFKYGLRFSAVAKRALEKSLAFKLVGSTYNTSRFN